MAVDPQRVASRTDSSPEVNPASGADDEAAVARADTDDTIEEAEKPTEAEPRVGSRPRPRPARWDAEDRADKQDDTQNHTAPEPPVQEESAPDEQVHEQWSRNEPPRQDGLAERLGVTLPAIVRREDPRRGRRVKRVVRRIELWSVLKVSLLFYFCLYAATLGAGVMLWGFAYSAGLIENFESFMQEVGFDDFRFFGDQLFQQAAIIGGALVMAASVLTVLAVALINLISEVTGGIRFVVIEEDLDERPSASRT